MLRKLITVFGTIGILLGCFALVAVMGSMRPKPESKDPEIKAPAVFYEEVREAPVQLYVNTQGEVTPQTEIALTAQVAGMVRAVAPEFNAGGVIRKGQMLVQIEEEDYRLAVTRAEASVAQAEQALSLEQAEAELALRDWQELNGGSDGSAPSALTLRKPQLNQAQANYDAAMADLRNAKLALKRTSIRAPFNGRIRSKSADIGQYIGPGSVVGQIFSTNIAEIRLPLADADLARLGLPLAFSASEENPGPKVNLSAIVAGQERNWQGRITRTDAAIDPRTRQISAIVEVADPYGKGADNGFPLAMGLFVNAAIEGRAIPSAITIPASALQSEDTVFIINADDTLELRQVTIAASTKSGLIVIAGLEDRDRVLLARLPGASDGFKVVPLKPGESRPSTTEQSDAQTSENVASDSTGEGDGAIQ